MQTKTRKNEQNFRNLRLRSFIPTFSRKLGYMKKEIRISQDQAEIFTCKREMNELFSIASGRWRERENPISPNYDYKNATFLNNSKSFHHFRETAATDSVS